MDVRVVPLEFRALLDRVFETFDYDATIQGFGGGDADPNAEMNIWLSRGANHMWRLGQKTPATPWEAEIDRLMQQQLVTLDCREAQGAVRPRADDRRRAGAVHLPGRAPHPRRRARRPRELHSRRCSITTRCGTWTQLYLAPQASESTPMSMLAHVLDASAGASHRSRAGGGVCLGRRAGVERADRSLQPADLLDSAEAGARPRSGGRHLSGRLSRSRRRAPASARSAGPSGVAHSDDAAQGLRSGGDAASASSPTTANAPSRPRHPRPTCRTPSFAKCSRPRRMREAVSALSDRCRQMVQMLFFETPPRPYKDVASRARRRDRLDRIPARSCLDRLRSALERDRPVPVAVAPPFARATSRRASATRRWRRA